MTSLNITPSGGLLTHQFIEAIQQPSFNHPALALETFALPGQKTPGPAELERDIGTAWELLVERWDGVERDLPGMEISALRERWIRPLFFLLDFSLEYQRAELIVEELRFPISHMGLPLGAEQVRVPVHTVLPAVGGRPAAGSLDARRESGVGLKRLAPHDLLQRYLNLSRESRWGLLSDGLRLRLLRDYHHTYTRGYVEFDLQGIFAGRDFAAFRALYRLCHASRFLPMPAAAPTKPAAVTKRKTAAEEEEAEVDQEEIQPETLTPLESFYQHALSTGVKVGEDLRENVRAAIETLANGFLQATPGLLDRLDREGFGETNGDPTIHYAPLTIHALYSDILHTIYRILFLLFAEQRGMFPGRGSLYMEEYSLTALRALAERPFSEDPHFDLWERLKAAFRMVEHGAPELGVFAYNGALFASTKTPILTPSSPKMGEEGKGGEGDTPALRNDSLLKAIRALTTVEREGVLQRISYADLSVEEMGSVYESLLDYTPRIAAAPETVGVREIRAGEFFLDPRGKERKTTGSYYTHPSLVNELIKSALLPVLEERLKAAVPDYDAEHPEKLAEDERQKAEAALLEIKVIDPAAGSGAFLIAADNALGLRLAQIRSGDLYPSEQEIRRARRDVLANCIYAVDLNPMAVELCKVSLWINAVVEDEPLNFLDHHIKCGNSLVGALRYLVAQGIPSEAYGGATGDDPDLARAMRRRNEQERAGQLSAFRVTELKSLSDLRAWAELSRLAQTDPAEAERRYRRLQEASEESAERLAFDLWTAAFFWPLEAETDGRSARERARAGIEARRGERRTPLPPTTQDMFQALAAPQLVDERLKAYARKLRDKHRFFHWELEFPEIFGQDGLSGFNVVLGNPPWERIKLQEKEFFADYDPEIAGAPNAATRRQMIAALPQNNSSLWRLYRQALRSVECTAKFLRGSSRFPFGSGGDVNTYSVFAELDRDLIAPRGRSGIVVPSGIATDYTNKDFFADMVEQGRLASLYDFENRRKLFPEVDSRIKFSLLTLRGPLPVPHPPIPSPMKGEGAFTQAGGEGASDFAFFLLSTDDLADSERRFSLSAADFALLNPNTRTCPVFRTRRDAELTRKLYRAAPVLVNEATGENPWGVSFMTMFHMANDSGLFRTREQLEAEGFRLSGNRFVRGEEVWLPLYEAKMIWHFDHRFNSFIGGATESVDNNSKRDANYQVLPRYWILSKEVKKGVNSESHWFIAFRDITNATNERTVIFAVIPFVGVGHTAPLLRSLKRVEFQPLLLANLNGIVFDYIARQKVGGTHLTYNYLKQLPALSPNHIHDLVFRKIVAQTIELTYTAWDIQPFIDSIWRDADKSLCASILLQWEENAASTIGGHANAVRPEWAGPPDPEGFPRPPFKWDEQRRAHLRADLDGLYAHLYGLTRDEFAYILDTFPIVRRKDEARYGEYRTKRLCLEAYDRLAGSDLIPPEARALQQESVIGERAAIQVKQPGEKGIKDQGIGERQTVMSGQDSTGSPAARTAIPETPMEVKQSGTSNKPTVTDASIDQAKNSPVRLPLADYGLYKCQACGKMVMGFDREGHTRQAHGGIEPGYQKVGR